MPLIRRIAALVSSFLLLQLTLVESGGICGSPAQRDGPVAAMAGGHPSHTPSSPSSGDECLVRHPPGACVSMPSCASAVVSPPAAALPVAFASSSGVPSETNVMPSPAAAGPDVPPPRG